MPAKLYALSLSHPSRAARLMLEHKGIEHEVIELLAGLHPLQLRVAGFRGGTVPALRLDGRRVQGSPRRLFRWAPRTACRCGAGWRTRWWGCLRPD